MCCRFSPRKHVHRATPGDFQMLVEPYASNLPLHSVFGGSRSTRVAETRSKSTVPSLRILHRQRRPQTATRTLAHGRGLNGARATPFPTGFMWVKCVMVLREGCRWTYKMRRLSACVRAAPEERGNGLLLHPTTTKIHESCFGVSALKHAQHKLETNISNRRTLQLDARHRAE